MQTEKDFKMDLNIRERDVAVVGLGLMGRSIAACLLAAGHRVIGLTNDLAANKQTPRRVRALLTEMRRQRLVSQSASALMEQFQMSAQISDLSQCAIVFESVTEDVELKREIFRNLEQVVSSATIIATNTSAIPVTVLQQGATHPQRIIGIHWDEPANGIHQPTSFRSDRSTSSTVQIPASTK